jgi:hypothetical protein
MDHPNTRRARAMESQAIAAASTAPHGRLRGRELRSIRPVNNR